jgi:hypothetical protein
MTNESGKHYFSMDRDIYTCKPDEKEILLQAGLTAKIMNVREETRCVMMEEIDVTVFELSISEKQVR